MIGEHTAGKGDKSRLKGRDFKDWENNHKLWDNLEKSKKEKALKDLNLTCQLCGFPLHLDLLNDRPTCTNNKCPEFGR